MICPECGEGKAKVQDTRDIECGKVKRLRKCEKCGYMFHTYEIAEDEYEDMVFDAAWYKKMMHDEAGEGDVI